MKSNVSRAVSRMVSNLSGRLARSRPAGIAAGAATALLALSTAAALGISAILPKPELQPAGGALSAGRNALQDALVSNAGADDPRLARGGGAGAGALEDGAVPVVGSVDAGVRPARMSPLEGGRSAGDGLYDRSLAAAGSRAAGGRGVPSSVRAALGGMLGSGLLLATLDADRHASTAAVDTGSTETVTPAAPTDPLAGAPAMPVDTSRASTPTGGAIAGGDGSGTTKSPVTPSDTGKAARPSGKTPVVAVPAAPTVAVVTPEPGTLALVGGGLLALAAAGLRRRGRPER